MPEKTEGFMHFLFAYNFRLLCLASGTVLRHRGHLALCMMGIFVLHLLSSADIFQNQLFRKFLS